MGDEEREKLMGMKVMERDESCGDKVQYAEVGQRHELGEGKG